MKKKKVSILGLGKLGLPLAAAIAGRGHSVVGYDVDTARTRQLQKGAYPFESGLTPLLKKHARRIRITSALKEIRNTDITFVVVPTPSKSSGDFSIEYLKGAIIQMAQILKSKRSFHIVAVVSTVLPGSMRKLAALLTEHSGKVCGRQIGLCYNPAFIALGNVIQNFLTPDFVLIGESDPKSGTCLEQFYNQFCQNTPEIHRMNFVNAEISKIAVNTFVTMKISFGNMIARLCERTVGAHADVVSNAVGADSRIGRRYLRGAVGYGGPCFPRDNKAFSFVTREAGFMAFGSEATDRINAEQVPLIAQTVLSHARPKDRIAILGLSYKPDTDVVEESQGVLLTRYLLDKKRDLVLYDPMAMPMAKRHFQNEVAFAQNLSDCVCQAQVLVIMTPWRVFKTLKPVDWAGRNGSGPRVLIDCWRMLEKTKWPRPFVYIPLGVGLPKAKNPPRVRV